MRPKIVAAMRRKSAYDQFDYYQEALMRVKERLFKSSHNFVWDRWLALSASFDRVAIASSND
jgi:hypothetical protein